MKNFIKENKSITITSVLILVFSIFGAPSFKEVSAYGGCSQYGVMVYEVGDSCQCMAGYSFGKDFMGNTSCISDSQLCKDEYGYNATSDYAGNCKCNYGYGFGKNSLGKTQCISLNDMCHDDLGYNSSYNTLYDTCECSYGYIIDNGQCVNGDSYCSSEHGLYSSYSTSSKKCECDSGYTFDENSQCVKKQNNVYFTVKELNTENKEAIIKSDYDFSYYFIKYNTGCYDFSFKRYLNHQIVVNLGTDFYLDTWDKIVLQDDDETCDITYKEKVDSSFSLEVEEENFIVYTPPAKKDVVVPVKNKPVINKADAEVPSEIATPEVIQEETIAEVVTPISTEPLKKKPWYKRFFNWIFK